MSQSQVPVVLVTKTPFAQERDGGSKRVAAIVRMLEGRGHRVLPVVVKPLETSPQVASVKLQDVIAALSVLWKAVKTLSPSVVKWYSFRASITINQLARQHGGTALGVVEYSQLMPYGSLFKGPRVIDTHNVESELLQHYAASSSRLPLRLLAEFDSRRLAKQESRLASIFDLVATVSARDAETLTAMAVDPALAGERIVTTTNGVSDEWFADKMNRVPGRVVFTAHLGWRPNIDAARWLVEQVWPHVVRERPDANLVLAGRSPSAEVRRLTSSTVSVLADVDDMIEVVTTASVATAPLLAAGGTRLKIIEALATRTPVVSTSLGAMGLEGLKGPALRIEDDPTDFADAIVSVLNDGVDVAEGLVNDFRWASALRSWGIRIQEITVNPGKESCEGEKS